MNTKWIGMDLNLIYYMMLQISLMSQALLHQNLKKTWYSPDVFNVIIDFELTWIIPLGFLFKSFMFDQV